MRVGDRRIFNDPKKLIEMRHLYEKSGYSVGTLKSKYGCNHATIIYHLRRAGILKRAPLVRITEKRPRRPCCGTLFHNIHRVNCRASREVMEQRFSRYMSLEQRNQGHTYIEYLEMESRRKLERFKCFEKAHAHGTFSTTTHVREKIAVRPILRRNPDPKPDFWSRQDEQAKKSEQHPMNPPDHVGLLEQETDFEEMD